MAQVLAVSQPPPMAVLVFVLSDCWEACATSAAGGGGASGHVAQQWGTGRGHRPPHPAAREISGLVQVDHVHGRQRQCTIFVQM